MGQTQTKVSTVDESKLNRFFDSQFENRLVAENVNLAQRKATELAEKRESLGWEVLAAATTTVILLAAGSIYKRKDLIIPIVPIIMATGYRYDVAHGENRNTIREEAEKLMNSNDLNIFGSPITLKDVENYRNTYFGINK